MRTMLQLPNPSSYLGNRDERLDRPRKNNPHLPISVSLVKSVSI
jgi:hypothetical protein